MADVNLSKESSLTGSEYESQQLYVENQKMRVCCRETIKAHASFNPMMVCQTCKYLIKCFTNEAAYRNYLIFCRSRGRHVLVDELDQYRVVVFRTYEPFR